MMEKRTTENIVGNFMDLKNKVWISEESLKDWILTNGSQGKTLIDLDIELKSSESN